MSKTPLNNNPEIFENYNPVEDEVIHPDEEMGKEGKEESSNADNCN